MNVLIDSVLEKYSESKRDSLIPILQDVQENCGFLPKEALIKISKKMGIPVSKIYGIATFYNQFRFHPTGKNHILVCRGTACHVKGSAMVLDTLKRELKIEPGQTSRDGVFSLDVVACIGACGLAPVLSINGQFHSGMTPEKTTELIQTLRNSL